MVEPIASPSPAPAPAQPEAGAPPRSRAADVIYPPDRDPFKPAAAVPTPAADTPPADGQPTPPTPADLQARVPDKPEGYAVSVAADFKLPEGVIVPEGMSTTDFVNSQIDPTDARIADLRAFAHEAKLPQGAVSKLIGIGIKAELAAQAKVNTGLAGERAKLGPNAGARVTAVGAGLKAAIGEAGMKALMPMMFSAAQVQAFEALLARGAQTGTPPPARSAADRMFPPEKDPYGRR